MPMRVFHPHKFTIGHYPNPKLHPCIMPLKPDMGIDKFMLSRNLARHYRSSQMAELLFKPY